MYVFTDEDPAAEGRYGSTGEMKKTQYKLQIAGFPGDPDTMKTVLTAVESGMEADVNVIDILKDEHLSADYLAVSAFGAIPALKENKYVISGGHAATFYIDARGLGYNLTPKKADLAATQNYWVDIAVNDAGPQVQTIMEQCVYASMKGGSADTMKVNDARSKLAPVLDLLNKQLAGKKYIIGDYTFADLHWTTYVHCLQLAGQIDLIDVRANIKAWFEGIKTKKSSCGQNIIGYSLLPSLEELRARKMKSVVISDF